MDEFPENCWVKQEDIMDSDEFTKYLVSYYWAFQTLTTVGYGDISLGTNTEWTMASMWMIFGVGFYSYTIGNMTGMIESFDADNQQLNTKMEALKHYHYNNKKLGKRLYTRIESQIRNMQI